MSQNMHYKYVSSFIDAFAKNSFSLSLSHNLHFSLHQPASITPTFRKLPVFFLVQISSSSHFYQVLAVFHAFAFKTLFLISQSILDSNTGLLRKKSIFKFNSLVFITNNLTFSMYIEYILTSQNFILHFTI